MMSDLFSTLPGVRKIAVLRANAIGDFVFSIPAFDALRAAYPDAEIVLIGQPWHERLMRGRPGPIDRVVVAPPLSGLYEEREGRAEATEQVMDEFFSRMNEEEFDLAIQMHGGGAHSNPFVRRLGARLTVGLCTPDAEPLDRWIRYVYFQPEILRCLEIVSLAGAKTTSVLPRLSVTNGDREEADRVLRPGNADIVVLNCGAGDTRRRWPTTKFAAVGDVFAFQDAQVVIAGSRQDESLGAAVESEMRGPVVNLAGQLSLNGLLGLYERATLVVSNDSGPLHLATAVPVPSVGIYWCGNLINSTPVTRADHRPILSWRLHCPVCNAYTLENDCSHRDSFVAEIPVEQVLQEALDLWRTKELLENSSRLCG